MKRRNKMANTKGNAFALLNKDGISGITKLQYKKENGEIKTYKDLVVNENHGAYIVTSDFTGAIRRFNSTGVIEITL